MKCRKCNEEVLEGSKFCNLCGAKLEELSSVEMAEQMVTYAKRMYFFFGLMHGISSDQPEEKKLKKIYEDIKNNSEFSEEIHEVVDYWNNELEKNRGKE